MIIDEKWMHPPPPPYLDYRSPPPAFPQATAGSSGGSSSNTSLKPTFSTLPAHLLLQIVYSTFPQQDGRYEGETKIERQRMNLYWLETCLRLVNKAVFIACMHILRSTYLPAYDSLIRYPYTSDPFSSLPTSVTELGPVRRELATLDLFIALLAHEDLYLDATSLHLPREEAYKDLFDLAQPRSRLEDLVLEEGYKAGLVYQGDTPPVSEPSSELDHGNTPGLATEAALVPAQPDVEGIDAPSTHLAASSSAPQPSSPTKASFNPFSRSSYISLAKDKMRRMTNPSPPPSIFSTPPASPVGETTFPSSSKVKAKAGPLPFEALSVQFSPRKVALVYMPSVSSSSNEAYCGSTFGALSVSVTGPTAAGGMKAKKTLVQVTRAKDEKLEVSAKRLIQGLEEILESE